MDEVNLVSVIMGVLYKKTDINPLKRSIRSILSQTFKDFELLICDDGSNESAKSVINDFALEDSRIKLVRSFEGAKYLTLSEKLNACLRMAKGDYIARMDDDDYSHPDRFAKQLSELYEHPNIGFIGCFTNLIRDEKCVGIRRLPKYPEKRDFLSTTPFVHPTLIFRRDVFDRIEGYSEEKSCGLCEDYELLMRLYANGFAGMNLQEELWDYTLPPKGKKNRTLKDRWNEAKTRFQGYKQLHLFPIGLLFVAKPLMLAILPGQLVSWLKKV
jgi:glycosyltransferase involved in cell wall biosynthesis